MKAGGSNPNPATASSVHMLVDVSSNGILSVEGQIMCGAVSI